MKLIKQSKLLTFQVIVSLIILNTQISFAQSKKINLKDWEGSYVGIGIANSSSTTEIRDVTSSSDHFSLNNGTKDKNQDEIIFKVGHLEQINNILLGIELNKHSDIRTESLNTNTAAGSNYDAAYDKTRLHLEDILSLDLRVGTVLENQDDFLNNTMVYGKVGIATLRSATRSHETGKPNLFSGGTYDYHIGQSKARHYGTVIGLGVEKKLSIFDDPIINKNTSISLEYNMMSFNKKTSGSDSSGAEQSAVGDSQYSVKPEINNLMLTVNYRFSDNTLGLKNLIK